MKRSRVFILVLSLLISLLPSHVLADELSLDSIAWGNLTYRDIFIDNNLAYMNGFDHGSWGTFSQSAGSNIITAESACTQPNSLKAAGTSSQQIISSTRSPAGDYFVASKVSCPRYVKGKLGVCLQGTTVGVSAVTKGFVTAAGIITMAVSHNIYIGSIHSANLDGFVDDPVVVNMNIFTIRPSCGELTQLYETYVEIEQTRDRNDSISTDAENLDAFMAYMQEKARAIGMSDSIFRDPVGDHCNLTTARDVARLMICADSCEQLQPIWSQSVKKLNVTGSKARTKTVESSVIKPELERYYHILGGKTGTLDGVRNLAAILEIPGSDDRLVVVVLEANGSNLTSVNRYQAARETADAAMKKYRDPSCDLAGTDVCCASAIACLIPARGGDPCDLQVLYEKDADSLRIPASITKVLTAVCALELMKDLQTQITYTQFDINTCPWFAEEFYAGDTVTLEHALYVLLLPSENVTAFAIARSAGEVFRKTAARKCGDVNGDETVNTMDLLLLRQYLSGWNVNADNIDVDGDGKCSSRDLLLLRQYLAGWDVTLG